MMEVTTTIQRTLIIPSGDLETLEQLKAKRGWKEVSSDKILEYFIKKKNMTPPISEEEINEQMQLVRHGI